MIHESSLELTEISNSLGLHGFYDETSEADDLAYLVGKELLQNGEKIRLIGQGKKSVNGGKNGDLFVKNSIALHGITERKVAAMAATGVVPRKCFFVPGIGIGRSRGLVYFRHSPSPTRTQKKER